MTRSFALSALLPEISSNITIAVKSNPVMRLWRLQVSVRTGCILPKTP